MLWFFYGSSLMHLISVSVHTGVEFWKYSCICIKTLNLRQVWLFSQSTAAVWGYPSFCTGGHWYWLAFQWDLFLPSCSALLLTCIMTIASIGLLCICVYVDCGWWWLSIQILYQLLQNVEQHDQAAQSFYQTYFTDILQHIFSVVTDTSHTAGEWNVFVSLQAVTECELISKASSYQFPISMVYMECSVTASLLD